MSVVKKIIIWVICFLFVFSVGFYGWTVFIPTYFREKLHYESAFEGKYVDILDSDFSVLHKNVREKFPLIDDNEQSDKKVAINDILNTNDMEINLFGKINLSGVYKQFFSRLGVYVDNIDVLSHSIINDIENEKKAYTEFKTDCGYFMRCTVEEYLIDNISYENIILDNDSVEKFLTSYDESFTSAYFNESYLEVYVITKWAFKTIEEIRELGVEFFKEETEDSIKIKAVLTREYIKDIFKDTSFYEEISQRCNEMQKMNETLYYIFDKEYNLNAIRYDIDDIEADGFAIQSSLEYLKSNKKVDYSNFSKSDYAVK